MKTFLRRLGSGGTLLALAAVLGLLTFATAFLYLQGRDGEQVAALPASTSSVVVARQEIPAGTEITATMIVARDVPTASVLGGSFTSVADVVGRVPRYPVLSNEQVVASKLVGSTGPAGTGLAFSIPPNMRAVSFPISQVTAAGGLIVPGDRVDIVARTEYERLFAPTDARDPRLVGPVTLTLLQDVLVLAIAQAVTPPIERDRDPATLRSDTAAPQPSAPTATVAVTPEHAQLLFMAQDVGKLGLSLRPFGAHSVESLPLRLKLESVISTPTATAANR